ncbi:MAG: DUF2071 domain-containing protein [Pyrinomonadaceae bacterium]
MKIPVLQGIIKRRILVNYRADPAAVAPILPKGFRPKLHQENAVVGICLIRLENIRPRFAPAFVGISSENAAHRIAVEWDQNGERTEGVFIPRRDTDSNITSMAGGRLFPGEHHRAEFDVTESQGGIEFAMRSLDTKVSVDLLGKFTSELPEGSTFKSLDEASEFFRRGSLGYSVTRKEGHLDGIVLDTKEWKVQPLAVESVASSFYGDTSVFPNGSIEFDHALIMRDVEHEWRSAPDHRLS